MFPPVTIDGRRYMDGGVHSCTCADVALEVNPELVVVIAPVTTGTAQFGPLADRCLEEEVAACRAAGAEVVTVLPEDAERAAFGPDLMSPTAAKAAREVGEARGRVLAAGALAGWKR